MIEEFLEALEELTKKIMRYFLDHWQGKFSVNRAGWMGSLVALLLVVPTNAIETYSFLSINHIHSMGDISARVEDGSIGAVAMPPFFVEALNQIVEMGVLIWWSVGAWRSCANPDSWGRTESWWFFKSMIIFAATIEVYGFLDFIKTSVGL